MSLNLVVSLLLIASIIFVVIHATLRLFGAQ